MSKKSEEKTLAWLEVTGQVLSILFPMFLQGMAQARADGIVPKEVLDDIMAKAQGDVDSLIANAQPKPQ